MANVLRPYGPDRTNILTRGNAAFVFCLHKLTPEDSFERQPILFADRFVMLFDGRIDNRCELGDMLAIPASELHSIPDSMLVLRLFDRWGKRAFERILGDFAVIIMDLQTEQLVCARDHMGLRVLHYHRSAKNFAVATAPDALFALSWVPRTLNTDKLADTLVNYDVNAETTYYQGVDRVLPGCIVQVRSVSFSKERFWDPENIADVTFKNDQDYVEAFHERLDNAVKVRLRSWRTPCATITGGLDSSSIAVTAADMLAANGQKLNTFTAVPEAGFTRKDLSGIYFDETPYVREIAQTNPNLIPHFIPPSKRPILDQIAEQIRIGSGPWGILNGLWIMQICGLARSAGHNVMLAGDMGNLTMSYHGRGLFAELVRTGRWLTLFREIKASGYQRRKMVRVFTISPFVPAPIYRMYKQWRRGGKAPWHDSSPIHPDFAASSGVVDRAACANMPFDARPPRNVRRARVRDFGSYCDTADWFATLRANFGIDTRTPAFDRRLVEFCIGIPQDQYLRNGCDRWLIRRAMKGRLPDVVLYKKKYGMQAADWFPRLTRERNQIAEEVRRLATNVEIASMLDLQRLTATLDDWPESQPPDCSPEEGRLLTIPLAMGAAYFVENATAEYESLRSFTVGRAM
jgi:asparagine synthase (glutamine-hydrolysing)